MKILVAEDQSLILQTIVLKLKKEGYEVIACEDGKQALKNYELHQPDVVITDVMLPFVSGLEIVEQIKKSGSKTITIVLSALGQEKAVEEAFDLGADDYIVKPFSLNELVLRIKKLCQQITP